MSRDYPPIEDYALIGDGRSAALVSRAGSIDWLCWPRFDSPSLFGRILDARSGGHFSITPTGRFQARREYVDGTGVLRTHFQTDTGRVELVDLMPALSEAEKRRRLLPFRGLLRRLRGLEGTVELEVEFAPRPDYGRTATPLRSPHSREVRCDLGGRLFLLRSEVPLSVHDSAARGRLVLQAGERRDLALAYSEEGPAVLPLIGTPADEDLQGTLDYWRRWTSGLTYRGPFQEAVRRSALVLKLLSYAPSGAIVAAPTTSLPEAIGSVRNWDYRYCWLRDASFTVRSLYDLGCSREGRAFVSWMLHATRLTHPRLQILYDVHGEAHLPERQLDHLEGYRGSRPVRHGNGAHDQVQLDVYGEVLEALEHHQARGGSVDGDTRRVLLQTADLVTRVWHEPDHGIWERRGGMRHHVHSKVMCWAALESAENLARRVGLTRDRSGWAAAREAIRQEVLSRGWDGALGSFVAVYGGRELDASLLLLPLVGFLPADDPRMLATLRAIEEHLCRGELIYRYLDQDGLPPGEGCFLACSFWRVSFLALAGRLEEAHRTFEALLGRGNDLGLFSEEMDPDTGEMLGNFPQGLTHIALIHAALTLEGLEEGPRGHLH